MTCSNVTLLAMSEAGNILRYTALSRQFGHEELETLAAHFSAQTCEAGTVLFAEGDRADCLYIVERGRIELWQTTVDGRRCVIERRPAGSMVGEGALLRDDSYGHGATCVDETQIFILDAPSYQTLLSEHPAVAARLLGVLSSKLGRRPTREFNPTRERPPTYLALLSAKGGCGCTFLAANLACVATSKLSLSTCLVDLDLQFGNLSTFVGFKPVRTLWDIVANEEIDNLDPTLMDHYGLSPCDGLRVFFRPDHLAQAEQFTPHHVTSLIDAFGSSHDVVVLDCGSGLNETTLAALDVADRVLVTTTADLGCISATRTLLKVLADLGYSRRKVQLIINRSSPQWDLPTADRSFLFEGTTAAVFPETPNVIHTLNRARLFALAHPAAELTESLTRLCSVYTRQSQSPPLIEPQGFLHRWLHWASVTSSRLPIQPITTPSSEDIDAGLLEGRRSAIAAFSLGQALYLVGRYDAARRSFEQAIERDDSLAAAHFHLGKIAILDEKTPAAALCLERAVALNPTNIQYRAALAVATRPPGCANEERAQIERAVQGKYEFADYHYAQATLLAHDGDTELALRSVDRALEINAHYKDALTLKGRLLRLTGKLIRSLETLLTAIDSRLPHVPAYYETGNLLCDLELYAFAQDFYRKVLSIYPGHEPSHRRIVALQEPLRVLRQEIDHYSQATSLQPSFGDYQFKLGVAFYQVGDFEASREQLARAEACGYDIESVMGVCGLIDRVAPLLAESPRSLPSSQKGQ